MRTIPEVAEMARSFNLKIEEDHIIKLVDIKAVTKTAGGYEGISVPERKKGKPTKRKVALCKTEGDRIINLIYCIDTTDVSLRELFRAVKESVS